CEGDGRGDRGRSGGVRLGGGGVSNHRAVRVAIALALLGIEAIERALGLGRDLVGRLCVYRRRLDEHHTDAPWAKFHPEAIGDRCERRLRRRERRTERYCHPIAERADVHEPAGATPTEGHARPCPPPPTT